MKGCFNKCYSTIYILKQENHFQRDSNDFRHKKMTLKVEFLQFLNGQKKLEEVSIKNEKLSHELLGNYLSKSAWLSEIQHIPGHAIVSGRTMKI